MPPGTPFYMTPAGHAALREELRRLWDVERPGDLGYPIGLNPLAAVIHKGDIVRGML